MKSFLASIRASSTRRFFLAWALALASAIALPIAGVGGEVEQQFQNLRSDLLEKPASGDIAIVEIDAKSIQALDRWPWPRDYYAGLVEKLSAADVAQIAFDVDFSANSTAEQDMAFAEALKKSQAAVILPTFKQEETSNKGSYIESLPIAILRDHAFLASVNVHPDENGQLNDYSYGTITDGTVRPSMAAMIAETPGNIDKNFSIDQSIDPATIPRFSFVDILRSTEPIEALKGKKILIGATAIELGDRYPISLHGVLPGVVVQAMAAETLLQGTNVQNIGYLPSLAFAGIVLVIFTMRRSRSENSLVPAALAIAAILFILLLVSEYFGVVTFSNVPALFFLGILLIADKFLKTNLALNRSRFSNADSALPNEPAMIEFIGRCEMSNIAVARLSDFGDLLVVTDKDSRIDLFKNLAERLKFLAAEERIFHLDTNIIGWVVKQDYANDISGHFDTAVALFHAPIMAGETKVKLNASFGLSGESIDKAKIASDQAIAKSKRWALHDAEAASAIGQKQNLLVEMEQAIERKHIWTVYQPKWNLRENRLDGVEALVRWKHPERGMISPELFIPILEKAGRIDELTLHVLQSALDDLSIWNAQRPGLSCSVNISAQLLDDIAFIDKAIAMVGAANLDNDHIIFEVTETAALADLQLSVDALERIRNAGISVSIDDYGTGQSTMSYLQRLPIDEIKIDQSFVKTMMNDDSNRLMVKSTIELAHALKLKVVAEGIEDQPCMDMLTEFGCDVGQGWHISKPVSSQGFKTNWLDSITTEKAVRVQAV
ncbi:EAL domain-containing protein [Parasphingorhabdus cellanae]|uniref:EAL domain-containing protein n=1 Tax=Parasphingorhabdus cellanae TaxID=2806553 RepID=A0ABX7T394_9SPHN|nr:EAL domain-containing protein [Parasphingorhabdus cellanae]QTD54448.1 EAL domain-containing protein [Parasphingorhabdus cellanae]